MENKLFVGNLSQATTEEELRAMFAGAGKVASVELIMDRDTGRSKGFAFIEMDSKVDAQAAIKEFNGTDLNNRTMKVNIAKPREARPRGGWYTDVPPRPTVGRKNDRRDSSSRV